jgi:hypothetical protein
MVPASVKMGHTVEVRRCHRLIKIYERCIPSLGAPGNMLTSGHLSGRVVGPELTLVQRG